MCPAGGAVKNLRQKLSAEDQRWYLYRKFPWLKYLLADVGSGWYPLIEQLCYEFLRLENEYGILPGDMPIKLTVIKEKFGALNVSFGVLSEEQFDMVAELAVEAERRSLEICERCGRGGKLREYRCHLFCRCLKCFNSLKRKLDTGERKGRF